MLHPISVRPGARFECRADGLCCSDVHALGPLDDAEKTRIGAIAAHAVGEHPRLGLPVLAVSARHACSFFEGDAGCRLHRERGAAFKPAACRRFPFGLVETPLGLRLTTAHRCPCRTVGTRKPIDMDEAAAALGAARVDSIVGARVPLTRRRRVGFARYRAWEAEFLASGFVSSPDAPLPALRESDWTDVAHAHRAMVDGTSSGEALALFGDALLAEVGDARLGTRARPFAWAFDRAARRASGRTFTDVFTDWAADVVWGLEWTEESSLGGVLAKLEVASRCAQRMTRAFSSDSGGEERAAAEAIAVVEVAMFGPFGYAAIDDEAADRAVTQGWGGPRQRVR